MMIALESKEVFKYAAVQHLLKGFPFSCVLLPVFSHCGLDFITLSSVDTQ